MADPATRRLRIHAVARAGWTRAAPEDWRLVETGELAAVVRAVDGLGEGDLQGHVRLVEALIRQVTLVPAPPGLTARDEASVLRFLRRARLPLLEALDLCEGCWELRIHLAPRDGGGSGAPGRGEERNGGGGEPAGRSEREAGRLFTALRRRARAARRLRPARGELASAAFLVPRARWIDFVDEATRREADNPWLSVDLTGPWAAWDFVRMFPEAADRALPHDSPPGGRAPGPAGRASGRSDAGERRG